MFQPKFVLCTHGHADHMAKDTLRRLDSAARFALPALGERLIFQKD